MIDLFLEDAIKVMENYPAECVDAIITDPPYLINYKTNYRKDKAHEFNFPIENDDNEDLIKNFIKLSYGILKPDSAFYTFCSPDTVDFFLTEIKKYFKVKNIIIWVKNNWTAGDLKAQYGKQYEMIIYANKGRREINGKRLTDVWFFDRIAGKKQLHRNQKPVELIDRIVEKSTKEGDVILDPFMGSGTTGVSAKKLNRSFIGVEINAEYFTTARERIEDGKD